VNVSWNAVGTDSNACDLLICRTLYTVAITQVYPGGSTVDAVEYWLVHATNDSPGCGDLVTISDAQNPHLGDGQGTLAEYVTQCSDTLGITGTFLWREYRPEH